MKAEVIRRLMREVRITDVHYLIDVRLGGGRQRKEEIQKKKEKESGTYINTESGIDASVAMRTQCNFDFNFLLLTIFTISNFSLSSLSGDMV